MEKLTVNVILFDVDQSNGRKYDEKSIKNAMDNYIRNNNGSSIIYGQMNPSDYALHTSISEASHQVDINSLKLNNDNISCEVEVLNTPNGKILQEMLNYGINPTFGIRTYFDNEKLNIISIDII